MNIDNLKTTLQECKELNVKAFKLLSDVDDKTNSMNAIFDRFLIKNIPEYSPLNTYYRVTYFKNSVMFKIMYTYDDSLAAMRKFSYEEIIKFNEKLEEEAKAYEFLNQYDDKTLHTLADIIMRKLDIRDEFRD